MQRLEWQHILPNAQFWIIARILQAAHGLLISDFLITVTFGKAVRGMRMLLPSPSPFSVLYPMRC